MATEEKKMLHFEETELLATANAVIKYNRSAAEKYNTAEDLVLFMKWVARGCFEEENATFASTYGFCLTAYPYWNGEGKMVRASVNASIL
jgi:hypothetical protein